MRKFGKNDYSDYKKMITAIKRHRRLQRLKPAGLIAVIVFVIAVIVASGCGRGRLVERDPTPDISRARMEQIHDVAVIHLYGSPYEMGYQQGVLFRDEVRASIENIVRFINREIGVPLLGAWYARRKMDQAWKAMEPYVPQRYLEEMLGLADGARIPLKVLQRVHALPELTSTSCSSFAAFGPATQGGQLIQIRNLDWAIHSQVQRFATVFVYHPEDRALRPFVNVGWLGFIGVISGISAEGISIGEIGAKTVDQSLRGIPMPFLLRRVLEEAPDLEEAVRIVQKAPRTVGYNYLFGDAQDKRAVALETTRSHCAVFWIDEEKPGLYRMQVPGAIFRSDFALDSVVRSVQIACKGDPSRSGLESPLGSSAYDKRYLGQGVLLSRFHGQVDPEIAMAIARSVAAGSNIQSIVYAYPELWLAIAQGQQPAAESTYVQLDLEQLFLR